MVRNSNGMRYGFTTGSCAAAAAKAACYMLLTGRRKDTISIQTPSGIVFNAQIEDIVMNENSASCAVIKDGGDDPDITTGVHVCASVTAEAYAKQSDDSSNDNARVIIDGGTGVGRVTRPGLDQPVGNAAINHVPRQMIADGLPRLWIYAITKVLSELRFPYLRDARLRQRHLIRDLGLRAEYQFSVPVALWNR